MYACLQAYYKWPQEISSISCLLVAFKACSQWPFSLCHCEGPKWHVECHLWPQDTTPISDTSTPFMLVLEIRILLHLIILCNKRSIQLIIFHIALTCICLNVESVVYRFILIFDVWLWSCQNRGDLCPYGEHRLQRHLSHSMTLRKITISKHRHWFQWKYEAVRLNTEGLTLGTPGF